MAYADIKAASRQALHEHMARPATYYERSDTATPESITIRRHDAPKMVGDLAGTNLSYAEVHERPTTLVVWNAELEETAATLEYGGRVILSATEGWIIAAVAPPDGQTTTVDVTPMSPSEINGLTLPDGTVAGAP